MKISIKNNKEIEKMRVAGKLASEVLEMITPYVTPGISTGELDKVCFNHIVNTQNAIPANVGYRGYEKTICSSINQVICCLLYTSPSPRDMRRSRMPSSA